MIFKIYFKIYILKTFWWQIVIVGKNKKQGKPKSIYINIFKFGKNYIMMLNTRKKN